MIEKVLALSTGHMPQERPRFGDVRVLKFEYGYVLFVVQDVKDVAEWLRPIMGHATKHECTLLLFDRDANDDPELFKLYDW